MPTSRPDLKDSGDAGDAGRGGARRGSLSQPEIVAAAVIVGDRDGLDAISMRRVATELGCEAMSLYRHVANKQDLLRLVAEAVLSEFSTPHPGAWRAQLSAISDEMRRLALAHPNLFPLVAEQLPGTEVALVPVGLTLSALRSAGLSEEDVVSCFWALASYTAGALVAEAAFMRGVHQTFPAASLPLEKEVAELAPLLGINGWEGEFRRGLMILLDAIEART